MLNIRSPEYIHLLTGSLYPLTDISPFPLPLSPLQPLFSSVFLWVWLLFFRCRMQRPNFRKVSHHSAHRSMSRILAICYSFMIWTLVSLLWVYLSLQNLITNYRSPKPFSSKIVPDPVPTTDLDSWFLGLLSHWEPPAWLKAGPLPSYHEGYGLVHRPLIRQPEQGALGKSSGRLPVGQRQSWSPDWAVGRSGWARPGPRSWSMELWSRSRVASPTHQTRHGPVSEICSPAPKKLLEGG